MWDVRWASERERGRRMDTNASLGTAPQQTLPRCGIPIQSHSNVHMALLFPFNRAQVSEPIFCPLHLNWHWDSQTLFGEKQPVHRNGGGALCSMSCSAKKLPLCRKAHIGSKRKCSWLRGEAGGVIAVNLNSLAVYPSIQFTLFFFFFYLFNSILVCFRGCSNINFPIKP